MVATLLYCPSAAAIWTNLRNQFAQQNGPKIYKLRKELSSVAQGDFSVHEYFTKHKAVWEEISYFRLACNCVCGGARDILEFIQHEEVLTFLIGLNEHFSNVRSQILAMDPFPSIEKVFALVLQDEQHKAVTAMTSAETQVAFAVKKHSSAKVPNNGKKKRPTRTHCGLIGHTMDRCYKIHGYPPGYSKNESKNSAQAVVNQVTTQSPAQSSMPLSSEQCQWLISLLS